MYLKYPKIFFLINKNTYLCTQLYNNIGKPNMKKSIVTVLLALFAMTGWAQTKVNIHGVATADTETIYFGNGLSINPPIDSTTVLIQVIRDMAIFSLYLYSKRHFSCMYWTDGKMMR